MNDMLVELELAGRVLAGQQLEIRCRRERDQPAQPPAARAVARYDLAELERDLVAHFSALASAGILLHGGLLRFAMAMIIANAMHASQFPHHILAEAVDRAGAREGHQGDLAR